MKEKPHYLRLVVDNTKPRIFRRGFLRFELLRNTIQKSDPHVRHLAVVPASETGLIKTIREHFDETMRLSAKRSVVPASLGPSEQDVVSAIYCLSPATACDLRKELTNLMYSSPSNLIRQAARKKLAELEVSF